MHDIAATHQFRYCRGYPLRYRSNLISESILILVSMSMFVVPAGIGVYIAADGLMLEVRTTLVLGLLLCGFLLLRWLRDLARNLADIFNARLILYFNAKVGDLDDVFSNGLALARNCERLDGLAREANAAPLSAFGFNDDVAHETILWHPPEQGLESLAALLDAVRRHPERVDAAEAVCAELEKMAAALRHANEKNVSFALLVRNGSRSCACHLEMDRRKGSFC